jgi:hypothetical protein
MIQLRVKAFFAMAACIGLALSSTDLSAAEVSTPTPPSGVWRGTSTCTDRVAAPACKDEVVVYEFSPGAKPGTIRWKADKVVDGQRAFMGELELSYASSERCWKAEFTGPRGTSSWCLTLDGDHMTGTACLLPGKQTIRKIDVKKD